jgi:autophagy-related protein 33
MEASYEVLGSGTDGHSEGTGSASGEEIETEEGPQQMNGEEVRVKVEEFLKKQMVQTAVAGLGFLMAVVGIWGDGAAQVSHREMIVFEV